MNGLPVAHVILWRSKTDYVHLIFQADGAVDVPKGRAWKGRYPNNVTIVRDTVLYPDDTVTRALIKIHRAVSALPALSFLKTQPRFPYAWTRRAPMRLVGATREAALAGWNVVPFLADAERLENVAAPTRFAPEDLFGSDLVHVAFYEDVARAFGAHSRALNHYFVNDDTLPQNVFKTLPKEERWLAQGWNGLGLGQGLATDKINPMKFSKGQWHGDLLSTVHLREVFHAAKTRADLPLIQFIEDPTHIYYKLNKSHAVPLQTLEAWTQPPPPPFQRSALVFYMGGSGNEFTRIELTEQEIFAEMRFAKPVPQGTLDQVRKRLGQTLAQWGKGVAGIERLPMRLTNLTAHTEMPLPRGTQMPLLVRHFAQFVPVFYVSSRNPPRATSAILYFKRVARYGRDFSLKEYVSGQLRHGVPAPEIERAILELGIDRAEFFETLAELQAEAETRGVGGVRRIQDPGLALRMLTVAYVLEVVAENAESLEEAQRAMEWLRRCRSSFAVAQLGVKAPVPVGPVVNIAPAPVVPAVPAPAPVVSVPKKRTTPATPGTPESLAESLGSDISVGGAIGKEYHNFFNRNLKQREAAFAASKKYTSRCQVTDLRQPILLTPEEKAAIDAGPYHSYDNAQSFQGNTYICPRLWCPESKVPLTQEEYVALGNKCPGGEQALSLYQARYWNFDPKAPRYAKLLKNADAQESLPCCFKIAPKEAAAATTTTAPGSKSDAAESTRNTTPVKKNKNHGARDSHLKREPGLLPPQRWGILPHHLHAALSPTVPYDACNKTLAHHACWLRTGVSQSGDSFMDAMAYGLGFANKAALVKAIESALAPSIFLALEGGHLAPMFAKGYVEEGGAPHTAPKTLARFRQWCRAHATDARRLAWPPTHDLALSRALALFAAWERFMAYVRSTEPKNPILFMDLARHLGALLVVFEKEDAQFQAASLLCPFYTSYETLQHAPSTVLLLKEGDIYQPLEHKEPGKLAVAKVALADHAALARALTVCDTDAETEADAKGVGRGASNWPKTWERFLTWLAGDPISQPAEFRLRTAVLGADHRIVAFVTHNDLWLPVDLPPSDLAGVFTPEIRFHEDMAGKTLMRHVVHRDWSRVEAKWKALGIAHAVLGSGPFVVPSLRAGVPPAFPQREEKDMLAVYERTLATESRAFHRLKVHLGTQLWTHYDGWVAPLSARSAADRLASLLPRFKALQRDAAVSALLQEIPMETRHQLGAWLREVRFGTPPPDAMVVGRREVVFAQSALNQGRVHAWLDRRLGPAIPPVRALDPVIPRTPRSKEGRDGEGNGHEDEGMVWSEALYTVEELPVFPQRRLPSCRIWVPKKHPQALFKRWLHTIARHVLGESFDATQFQTELLATQRETLLRLVANKAALTEALDSSVLRKAFGEALGVATQMTLEEIAHRVLERRVADSALIDRVMVHVGGVATELALDAAARLLGVIVWVLYKNKKRAAPTKRGTIEEILQTSNVFAYGAGNAAWKKRPLLLLFKDTRADDFGLVAAAGRPFWELAGADAVPPEMREVLERMIGR